MNRKPLSQDPVDIASADSFPASDPPSRTVTTGIGESIEAPEEEKGLMRSGLGWRHALLAIGGGMVAAAAGIWQFRRRRSED